MLSLAYPFRWPIWSSLWSNITNVFWYFSRPFHGLLNGIYALTNGKNVEQCTSTEREMPTQAPSILPVGRPSLEPIARGTVSVIYALDADFVIKRRLQSSDEFICQAQDIEIRVYERLGKHPRIAFCREVTNKGLVLERGQCLRQKLQSLKEKEIAKHTRLQWAKEAAEGLQYIHEKGIIHADIGCHNMILDRANHVKFIDFAGSGIDAEPALVCYEWCSYRPDSMPNIKTDIFAFGSMLFEIESGNVPYHELQETLGSGKLIKTAESLFSRREYPETGILVLKDVIIHCWDGDYDLMDEVYSDISVCYEQFMSE